MNLPLQTELSWQELQEAFYYQTPEEQEELKNAAHEFALKVNNQLYIIKKADLMKATNSQITDDLIAGKINWEAVEKIILPRDKTLYDTICNFFDKRWNSYQKIDWKPIIYLHANGFIFIIQAQEKSNTVVLELRLSLNIPEEKRKLVSEFITRANYGIKVGWFQMDLRDWEINYNIWINVEDWILSDEMIVNMISYASLTTKKYLWWIAQVVYSWKTPEEAIKEIEWK